MFPTIIPRKTGNGKSEKLIAYNVKELYCISRYNTPEGKLQYQTFFKDINKYAKDANFDKIPKDDKGKLILPKIDTMKRWPDNYGWEEDYKIYEDFMNGTAQSDFQKMYVKNMRKVGVPLIDIKTNLILKLLKMSDLPLDALLGKIYQTAKLGELLKMIDELTQENITFGNDVTESENVEDQHVLVDFTESDIHERNMESYKELMKYSQQGKL